MTELKSRIPLDRAEKVASQLICKLERHCERIMVAGSIRRCVDTVGDIDLVVLPRDRDAFIHRVVYRQAPGKKIHSHGPQNISLQLSGNIPVQIFMARPSRKDLFDTLPNNWGSLLLCRTGSKEHNVRIARRAQELGLKWDPYTGIIDPVEGTILAAETEESIYQTLELDYLQPENRI